MKQIMSLLYISILGFAAAALAAPSQSRFVFGPMYGWRYPLVQSHIDFAETTLCPGRTPSPEIPRASLWLGMEVPNDRSSLKTDLIQAIVVSDPGVYRRYATSGDAAKLTYAGNAGAMMESGACLLVS
jgi:hypothetical protein